MSIDRIIASIPTLSTDQRKGMRTNAVERLASGDPKWAKDAPLLLAALDAQEESEARSRNEARTARMAELENSTVVERIVTAFELEAPTSTETKVIQALLDHPGGSCAELSTSIGWDPVAWDMQFGSLCSRRVEVLWPLEPLVREEANGYIRLLTTQHRDEHQTIRYEMRPEAVAAFKVLGIGKAR